MGALYGGALAASLLKDPVRADALAADALRQAATATPRDPAAERAIVLLQAQLRLARGDAAGTLALLDGLGTQKVERPPLLLRAQALLDLNRAAPGSQPVALRNSTEALQTWVAEQNQDAAAWELLAATGDALGLKLRSMRAAAEARVVVGDLTGAIDRLRAAQAVSRGAIGQDFIEGSVIDARLRQITAQRRQLQLDARESRGSNRGGPDEPQPQ